jgi:hypothetical protein
MKVKQPESWRAVPGSESIEVSSRGRVRVWRTDGVVFRGDPTVFRPHLFKLQPTQRGYSKVGVTLGGRQKSVLVHRLVALAFIPNPEGKPQVNHKNGQKNDNRPAYLEWMTGPENMAHARELHGVGHWAPHGVASGAAKLTELDVRFIRDSLNRGTRTRKELAAKLKVSVRAICKVANRKSWAHVD